MPTIYGTGNLKGHCKIASKNCAHLPPSYQFQTEERGPQDSWYLPRFNGHLFLMAAKGFFIPKKFRTKTAHICQALV